MLIANGSDKFLSFQFKVDNTDNGRFFQVSKWTNVTTHSGLGSVLLYSGHYRRAAARSHRPP